MSLNTTLYNELTSLVLDVSKGDALVAYSPVEGIYLIGNKSGTGLLTIRERVNHDENSRWHLRVYPLNTMVERMQNKPQSINAFKSLDTWHQVRTVVSNCLREKFALSSLFVKPDDLLYGLLK